MIETVAILLAVAGGPTRQAPPGWGEAIAFLMISAVVLSISPTVLAAIVGGISGRLTSGTTTSNGILVGLASGVVGTALAWGYVGLALALLELDIDPDPNVHFAAIGVALVSGVLAPVVVVRLTKKS